MGLVMDDEPLFFPFSPFDLCAQLTLRAENPFFPRRSPSMATLLTDPACHECGGPLAIVDQDESFVTVVCADCGNSHGIEVTTAANGTPKYWPAFRISLKGDVPE